MVRHLKFGNSEINKTSVLPKLDLGSFCGSRDLRHTWDRSSVPRGMTHIIIEFEMALRIQLISTNRQCLFVCMSVCMCVCAFASVCCVSDTNNEAKMK
jgi:hypothetical protein